MKFNFRKLKNSLLSLGLTATLLFPSGLRAFAAPLTVEEVRLELVAGGEAFMHLRTTAALARFIRTCADISAAGIEAPDGTAAPPGTLLPIVPTADGRLCVHASRLAELSHRPMSELTRAWTDLGYLSARCQQSLLAAIGMAAGDSRFWTLRWIEQAGPGTAPPAANMFGGDTGGGFFEYDPFGFEEI